MEGREQHGPEFADAKNPVVRAQELLDTYPEMHWLVGDGNEATPEKSYESGGKTVGETLYPHLDAAAVSEFNRTLVGVQALDWVLSGDYDSFTSCQPDAVKMTPETFSWLQNITHEILPDAESKRAMETFIVTNDLGKVEGFIDAVRAMPSTPDTVDHDVLMHHGLAVAPELSPSFESLDAEYQHAILDGMGTKFNLGQLMQGENVPASLNGLVGLDRNTRNFYLLHTLYDIAGAAGQFVQNGSVVVNEGTAKNFQYAVEALDHLDESGGDVIGAYDAYLTKKADDFGYDIADAEGRALTRVGSMMRLSSAEDGERLNAVFNGLDGDVRAILKKELNRHGVEDGRATLPYYAPAVLANLAKQAGADKDTWASLVGEGLTGLARVMHASRIKTRNRDGSGVTTVLVKELADQAATNPLEIKYLDMDLEEKGIDAELHLSRHTSINTEIFPAH